MDYTPDPSKTEMLAGGTRREWAYCDSAPSVSAPPTSTAGLVLRQVRDESARQSAETQAKVQGWFARNRGSLAVTLLVFAMLGWGIYAEWRAQGGTFDIGAGATSSTTDRVESRGVVRPSSSARPSRCFDLLKKWRGEGKLYSMTEAERREASKAIAEDEK